MSNASNGKKYEKEVKDILKARGWEVEQAMNKTIWLKNGRILSISHDFFNVWDIVAKKLGEPTLWVQVTTIAKVSSRKQKILEKYKWNMDVDTTAIYGRIGGRGAHYKVFYGDKDFEWEGETALVLPKKKKEAA